MQVFTPPKGIFKSTADNYKRPGERIRITQPIEFEGKKYRQVLYKKAFLGKMKNDIEGIVILNEDGEYISDTRVKKELVTLGYHFEAMLDDKGINELKNAMNSELELQMQADNYEDVIETIQIMKNSNIAGIDTVVSILKELPVQKKESNKAIGEYLKRVQSIKQEGFVFNYGVYDELYPYYREIFIKNFRKVKLVASGKNFYDDIKKEGQKRRKNIMTRLNSHEVFMGLNKLPVEIDLLRNIVKVYESVLDMKEEEYLRHLKSIEKNNINDRIKLLR